MPLKKTTPKAKARAKAEDSIIVVGIDFGTTFSGMAWTHSGRSEFLEIISKWDGLDYHMNDRGKCPTTITYHKTGEVSSWGYGVPPEDVTLKWFKLLLLDDADVPSHIQVSTPLSVAKQQLKDANKTPVEVIADYLDRLWQHALENIERSIGHRLLTTSRFRIVVTLPAIWPHYAQIRMREAMKLAGIMEPSTAGPPMLSFISEPEAAALATMDDMVGRSGIKQGDHFIVCDAGGGTVDIISYTVTSLNPLTVRESVKGNGNLNGAIVLDDGFLKLMRKRIHPAVWDKLGPPVIKRIMNVDWEKGMKSSFCDNGASLDISLPFGGTIHDKFQSPNITFNNAEILSVYKPVIDGIELLIQDQIAQVKKHHKVLPTSIVLVGGLGSSPYLYKRLRSTMGKKIEIIQSQGERPWTAVARGAVIQGLTQSKLSKTLAVAVDSRISRKSYGTLFNVLPFDPLEHHVADRSFCEVQQEFLALDQTKWFLETGEELGTEKPICAEFWQDIENPNDHIEIELIVSEAAKPPTRKDNTVKSLCTINISKVPNFDKLPTWTNREGTTYRRVQYQLKMVCDHTSLDVGVYHKGKRLGCQNVSVEFSKGNAKEE